MFALLVQRNFLLLWIAHTISILGDYVFFIAITFWIYEQTGSASATGTVLIVSTVPMILFAPFAGIVVDNWDRRSIMFIAESARAILFLLLFIVVLLQPHIVWPIYLVSFVQSALAVFFWPARGALLPQMIEPPALLTTNALYMVSDSIVRIVAPSLSAFALLHLGPAGIIGIDAASFMISAGSICLLNIAPSQRVGTGFPGVIRRRLLAGSSELRGMLALSEIPGILARRARWTSIRMSVMWGASGPFILVAIVAFTAGTLSILLPVYVRTILVAGPLAYGWILTAQAIGEGAISLLLERIVRGRGRWKVSGLVSGCFIIGGCMLPLIVFMHTLVAGLLLSLVFGAMTAATTIQLLTFLQRRAAKSVAGKVLAAYTAVQALAQVVGMGIAGMLAVHVMVVFDGALYLLGGGLVWVVLVGG